MSWEELGKLSRWLCKVALHFLLSEITKSFALKWEVSAAEGKRIYQIYEN